MVARLLRRFLVCVLMCAVAVLTVPVVETGAARVLQNVSVSFDAPVIAAAGVAFSISGGPVVGFWDW